MKPSKYEPMHTIRKLQIKIPNFSQGSTTKIKSKTLQKNTLYSSYTQHQIINKKSYSQHGASKNNRGQFDFKEKQKQKQKFSSGGNKNKGLKIRLESKSPKNRYHSPSARLQKQKIQHRQLCKTQANTCRNIDEVKNKLKTLSSKTPISVISNKYFKKQIATKAEDLNKTLKKMAERHQVRRSKYELKMICRIGKSQNGDIILARSNINGLLVAIKTFKKSSIKLQYLIDEMKIHLYCEHPNILPAYGYHVGRDEVYLCMEFGFNNLYEQILRRGPFSQEKTAKYTMQILAAVEYLHRNGIIHRDLKPENVICFGDMLKITDFGWSIKTDVQRRTLCGTLDYISPEVAERSYYDNKIDCWSVGVLMYEMLTVRPPFSQSKEKYNFGELKLPEELSEDCRHLLLGLLKVEPSERISAREALDHRWIRNHKNYNLLFQRRQFKEVQAHLDRLFSQ